MKLKEIHITDIRSLADDLLNLNEDNIKFLMECRLRPDLLEQAVEIERNSSIVDRSNLTAEDDQTVADVLNLCGDILILNGQLVELLRSTQLNPELLERLVALDARSVQVADKMILSFGVCGISSGGRDIQASHFFKSYLAFKEMFGRSGSRYESFLDKDRE